MTTCHLSRVELQRYFEVFDEDFSGAISAEELCEAFMSLGWDSLNSTHCEHMIREQFGSDTTSINFEQFCELVDAVQMPTDSLAECQRAFKLFDKSNIGKITVADLAHTGRLATGKSVPDTLIREILEAVDLNRDGFIQFDEFHAAVAKVGIRDYVGGSSAHSPSRIFEKEVGVGVGFGLVQRSGVAEDHQELMTMLMEGYNEEGGNSGSSASFAMNNSLTFKGRTVRARGYTSNHWSVRPHITPSQRADIQRIVDDEWQGRSRRENDEEAYFRDFIIMPLYDGIDAINARVEATRLATIRDAEARTRRAQEEREAAAAAAAEKKAAVAAAAAEKRMAAAKGHQPSKVANRSPSNSFGAPSGATGKSVAVSSSINSSTTKPSARPPVATPRVTISTTSSAAAAARDSSKEGSPPTTPSAVGSGITSSNKLASFVGGKDKQGNNNNNNNNNTAVKKRGASASLNVSVAGTGGSTSSRGGSPNNLSNATGSPTSISGGGGAVGMAAASSVQQGNASIKKESVILFNKSVTFFSGFLGLKDARAELVQYGYPIGSIADEDFADIFNDADKDGDGLLSVDDYKYLLMLFGEC